MRNDVYVLLMQRHHFLPESPQFLFVCWNSLQEVALGGSCTRPDDGVLKQLAMLTVEHFVDSHNPMDGKLPFQISQTQTLQSLIGMEAWFFTRINGATIDEMKANKGLEFVWRASSSLADADTEIFTRILESYYCLPLPTFAFEWGEDRGAKIPSDPASTLEVSETLANITKQRAPWFRTNNVMIPWGCDYMYQNAALMFGSTDKIIDTINAHPEWGVHAQYATPSEYLSAVRASNATFPVKPAGTNFFPFTSWSGYFTSRPKLKGLNTKAHAALNAAEQLFALSKTTSSSSSSSRAASSLSTDRAALWTQLENARRFAGVVQHHDAITGTMCKASEGCAGTDQVVGAHDVLTDYEGMLLNATESAHKVAATILAESSSNAGIRGEGLSANVGKGLGDTLMGQHGDGGDDAIIVVYNSLAYVRTEMVVVQVPVCAVTVSVLAGGDSDNSNSKEQSIASQVTAEFSISAGQAPFYDFELSFEATVPPLSSVSFRISPSPADAACGGGDARSGRTSGGTQHFVRHASVLDPDGDTFVPENDATCNVNFHERVLARARDLQSNSGNIDLWAKNLAKARAEETATCKHNNNNKNQQANNKASTSSVILENKFLRVTIDTTRGLQSVTDKVLKQTIDVRHELFKYASTGSDAYAFNPAGPATPLLENATASVLAATVALGSLMQEVWLQVSAQHKTRIRIWVSDDPEVGRRIELAHRIGVLEPMQDLISRFTVPALQGIEGVTFVSEDNGYEKVEHEPGTGGNIATHHYPSQASAFIRGPQPPQSQTDGAEPLQLSVALDRSHAVGSMSAGTLDIMQHR